MVRRPPRVREIRRIGPRFPGALRFWVSVRTGRPGASILRLGEVESLIHNIYLNMAVREIEQFRPLDAHGMSVEHCGSNNNKTLHENPSGMIPDTTTTNNNNNRIQRRYSRFFTISSQRREPSPTRTLKWPGRNRVQITCNTERLSRASVLLRATWYEGTAQLLSLTELKSHLFELYFIG